MTIIMPQTRAFSRPSTRVVVLRIRRVAFSLTDSEAEEKPGPRFGQNLEASSRSVIVEKLRAYAARRPAWATEPRVSG